MNIQWFPGHMSKTMRVLQENLKMVDVVIELLDARIPFSSKNPEIDKIVSGKPKVVALNKADLADESVSKKWSDWYEDNDKSAVFIDSIRGHGINRLKELIRNETKEKIKKEQEKGRRFRAIRTMIVGIPNVGKSSFINKVSKKSTAKTGDRPGVTKNKQWIRINNGIEMLDTPGILWPKFDNIEVGLNLACTGAIRDEIMDTIELVHNLVDKLFRIYPKDLENRYKVSLENCTCEEMVAKIAKKRGCLAAKGEIDYYRIASIILDEFRGGKIGRISLELPQKPIQTEGDVDGEEADY
jgi:ribosome biogenesis GTPase A